MKKKLRIFLGMLLLVLLSGRISFAQTNQTSTYLKSGKWTLQNVKFADGTVPFSSSGAITYQFATDTTLIISNGTKSANFRWKYVDAAKTSLIIFADEASNYGYNIYINSISTSSFVFRRKLKNETTSNGTEYELVYTLAK